MGSFVSIEAMVYLVLFTTHHVPYNSIHCLIIHEIDGKGSISEGLNILSISFVSGSTRRDVEF